MIVTTVFSGTPLWQRLWVVGLQGRKGPQTPCLSTFDKCQFSTGKGGLRGPGRPGFPFPGVELLGRWEGCSQGGRGLSLAQTRGDGTSCWAQAPERATSLHPNCSQRGKLCGDEHSHHGDAAAV